MDEKRIITSLEGHEPPAESFEERMKRRASKEAAEPKTPTADVHEIGYRWRKPEEAPKLATIPALFKLSEKFKGVGNLVLGGVIYEDGVPAIFDLSTARFIEVTGWKGIVAWFPVDELPKN